MADELEFLRAKNTELKAQVYDLSERVEEQTKTINYIVQKLYPLAGVAANEQGGVQIGELVDAVVSKLTPKPAEEVVDAE